MTHHSSPSVDQAQRASSEEAPSSRRRHRRHRRHPGAHRKSGPRPSIRDWAAAVDSLFRAVEDTAWAARDLTESIGSACERGGHHFESRRSDIADWATRLTQTGLAITKIAADYRLYKIRAAFLPRDSAALLLERMHEKNARLFRDVSLKHGGAFLKVGQLLSARPDLLPATWVRELTPLQDAALPISFEIVRGVIESDLGRTLESVFATFDATPLAAASVGQVHRATLFDGTEVAVKVQHPGIAERIRTDLVLLEAFVGSLRDSLPEADYETILGEIRTAVLQEVDYEREARHTASVSTLFASIDGLSTPEPIASLCTQRVLVTRFVHGRKITIVLDELAERRDRIPGRDLLAHAALSEILGQLLQAYLMQVLQGGVFQADPHPGNLLVGPDGEVTVLDFGCAGELTAEKKQGYVQLLGAALGGNRERMTEVFATLGFETRSGRPDTLHTFADLLLNALKQAAMGAVRWPTKAELGEQFSDVLRACHEDPVIRIPPEFVMIGRVFGTLGGLFAKYEPDIDFGRYVLPTVGPAFFAAL